MQLDPIVEEFRERPLEKSNPFVLADAIYRRVHQGKRVVSMGLFITIGVSEEGQREVLGFHVHKTESTTIWKEFFQHLEARGIHHVDMVTSDAHGRIKAAIQDEFPGASWQRCQSHFSKNVQDACPAKHKAECLQGLHDMYNAPTLDECRNRRDTLLEFLFMNAPKAARVLEKGFDDVTAVYGLPTQYRKKLHTSNSVERLNEELRRRQRVLRMFANEQSLIRLVGAIQLETHNRWMNGKSYMMMDAFHESRATSPMGDEDMRLLIRAI